MAIPKKYRDVETALNELMESTNFYDAGDVDVALDALASTLEKAFLKVGLLSRFRTPNLGNVLSKMVDKNILKKNSLELFGEIDKFLDEFRYPEDEEIEDPTDLQGSLENLQRIIEDLIEQ